MNDTVTQASIEADWRVPTIRITRDVAATPAQLSRVLTDPALFLRWVGLDGMKTTLDRWNASTGGSWCCVSVRDAWLRSGMEVGVDQGYAKLDVLLAAGDIAGTAGRAQA